MECLKTDSQYKLQAMNSSNMKVCRLREILEQRENELKMHAINKDKLKVHLRNQKYQNQLNFQTKDDFIKSLSKGLELYVSQKIFDVIIADFFTKSIRKDANAIEIFHELIFFDAKSLPTNIFTSRLNNILDDQKHNFEDDMNLDRYRQRLYNVMKDDRVYSYLKSKLDPMNYITEPQIDAFVEDLEIISHLQFAFDPDLKDGDKIINVVILDLWKHSKDCTRLDTEKLKNMLFLGEGYVSKIEQDITRGSSRNKMAIHDENPQNERNFAPSPSKSAEERKAKELQDSIDLLSKQREIEN